MCKPTSCTASFNPGQGYHCDRCNLTWDQDDIKPFCLSAKDIAYQSINTMLTDDPDQPHRLVSVLYNNENLIFTFSKHKFKGIDINAGSSVEHVVNQLRSLAAMLEREVK